MRLTANTIIALLALASTAAAQDIASDLELHATFDTDGSDETANKRDLTAVGEITHDTGHIGNCARIGTNNGGYKLADASFLNGAATYSLAFWVRRPASSGTYSFTVVGISADDDDKFSLGISEGARTLKSRAGGFVGDGLGAGAKLTKTIASPTDGDWRLVCIVVSSGDATLYYATEGDDAATSKALEGDWTLPSSGCVLTAGTHICDIDELRVYSRALSSDDVAALFDESDE